MNHKTTKITQKGTTRLLKLHEEATIILKIYRKKPQDY